MARGTPIGAAPEPVNLLELAKAGESFAVFRSDADLDPLVLDLTNEEAVSDTVEVSTSPIEEGADITDHVRRSPTSVRFRGLLVNAPYNPGAARARELARGSGTLQNQLRSAAINGPRVDETRAQSELDRLRSLLGGEPVILITGYGVFRNMMLTSLEHRPAGKGAVEVSGSFVRVAFATVSNVYLPPEPIEQKDKGKTKGGTKSPKEAEESRKSLAFRVLEAAR